MRLKCENCGTVLVPYGSEACWACARPSARLEPVRQDGQRTVELISIGGGAGATIAWLASLGNVATTIGAAIGAGVVGLGLLARNGLRKRRAANQLAAGDPVRILGASPLDDANRARLAMIESQVVAFLGQADAGLRANADAVAARGSSTPALERARQTLEQVRGHYETHLANTLVALETVAVAAWLRRMSALVALPIDDADQARAVLARFDQDLAAAGTASYERRAQLAAGADPSWRLVVRAGLPPLPVRSELAAALPARFAELWTRGLGAAAPLRSTVTDRLELAAVRAAADLAGRTHLLDNPEQPALAITATASVVDSLESEVARLIDESDRIRNEADAMREVEQALA